MNEKATFAGISGKYAQPDFSAVVCIPVPYDGTSTWGKGADEGPSALLEAAENMELFDIETGSEPYKKGIYLAEPITENQSPEAMTEAVYKATHMYLEKQKKVTLIGGEHSISIGAQRAARELYPNLNVLQLDAHADLRSSYEGSACNHACAVHEASKYGPLVQVGIRSMDISEEPYMNRDNVFFAHELTASQNWIQDVLDRLNGPVYLTIDLDAFDPSILPATGTPEPGGLMWYPTLQLLKRVFTEKQIVGFDLVELCPNPYSKPSNFLAAKLYYKLLAYWLQ
jgi:agmatinase